MGSYRIHTYLPNQKTAFCWNDLPNDRVAKPSSAYVHLNASVVRHLHLDSVATRNSFLDKLRACQRNIRVDYLLSLRTLYRYRAG